MSERLLAAVRAKCPPGLWSQGVKLARDGAVTIAAANDDEVTARVRERGRAVPCTVILYPKDEEWDCDCEGKVSPCSHVAASAIVLAQEAKSESGTERRVPAHLGYRFGVEHTALTLDRVVVSDDGEEQRLDQPLADRIARGDRSLDATHEDLAVDRIMGRRVRGDVPFQELGRVFSSLSTASDVQFRSEKIRLSSDAVGPEARLIDAPSGGVELVLAPRASIEVVAMGVALFEGALVPLELTSEYGLSFERLPQRRVFARGELGELVTVILPGLAKKMPVRVETKRLPKTDRALTPRIEMNLAIEGHTLGVLPLLVYGDPAVARVEGGRLVLLPGARGAAPVRDEAKEQVLLAGLRDELSMVPGRKISFDGKDASRFVERLERFMQRHGSGGQKAVDRELVPRIEARANGFDLWFELPEGDERDDERDGANPRRRATGTAAAAAFREGLSIVPLEGGGFARLPADFLAKHGEKVADLIAAKEESDRVPKTLLPMLGELCDALGAPRPTDLAALEPLFSDFTGIAEAPLPDDLNTTLRPYQREGMSWLAFLRDAELGGILADDMGLGKTVQALAALKGKALVVCPKSVVHNWASEIARFRPSLRVSVYEGKGRALDDCDVTLTSYGLLRIDADVLAAKKWDVAILDEAQAIKNADSQVARAAFRLDASFRLAMSGTPVENRLDELWSLMRFANPGLLGTRSHFDSAFGSPIANGDAGAAARLRARIRPFVLRRTKREVLPELPPRTEAVMMCELEPNERAVYDAVRAATRKDVVERLREGGSVLAALEALLRLRQAACHPALVPGQRGDTSSKVERLVDALEELLGEGHRALVFSQWTSFLDKVEPHLQSRQIRFGRLDGSTVDRAGVVREFQSEDGPPVLLLSLKAGGTGLNLTAADHVFLLDPWWNPAAEDQAADRAHRIGQDKPVMIYRLVAKDTVEEKILALQDKKRAIAGAALGEADQALAITRDDLYALLT